MLFSLYAQQTSSASYFPYMLIFSLVLCHRLKRGRETKTQKEREREKYVSLCKAGCERPESSLGRLECHRNQCQINTGLALHVAKISMSICLKKKEKVFQMREHFPVNHTAAKSSCWICDSQALCVNRQRVSPALWLQWEMKQKLGWGRAGFKAGPWALTINSGGKSDHSQGE